MRKVLVDNSDMFVSEEVGGMFNGIIYQKMKKHHCLIVFIPNDDTITIEKTSAGTLVVNGWLVQSPMVWGSDENRYIDGFAVGVLYQGGAFFNDDVRGYCRALMA